MDGWMQGFFFFFFFQFCDVATIGDHLQEELAKFGNFRTKIPLNLAILVPFFQCKNPLYD
jgi:hypothetical protein